LAVGVNVCQSSGTHPDHVILIFGRLCKHYQDLLNTDPIIHAPVVCIIESLERRWKKVDQAVFILALAFNPFLKNSLLHPSITMMALVGMAKRVYCRVFKQKERKLPPVLEQTLRNICRNLDLCLEIQAGLPKRASLRCPR
jgi:hypothetical protein